MNETVTLQDILKEAQKNLSAFASARLDAELLLCEVMQCERSRLYSETMLQLPAGIIDRFHVLVGKRKSGVPVAYLTGRREFWSMQLEVNADTLVPRPETECLVEKVLTLVPRTARLRIADPGTGSGAIALAIARERPGCSIVAGDVSIPALAVADRNARLHGLHNIRFLESDWLESMDGKFHFIVSNPPYVPSADPHFAMPELQYEPVLALDGGQDGLASIRKIICQATAYLHDNGWLLLEHGYDQAAAVQALLRANGFMHVGSGRDYAGIGRFSFGQAADKNAGITRDG